MALKVVFMGTPDFSVPVLQAIHEAGHEIVVVYSQPPRPAGRRGLKLTPSPVHQRADDLGIPVLTPASLKDADAQAAFAAHDADIAVVVAYGLLLPQAVLDAPRHGCLNIHASLLPRWRGAAPIQRTIEARDAETGVMVMRMEAGLDTGPVALTAATPIAPDETGGSLHDRLSAMGAALIVKALALVEGGTIAFVPQADVGMTYARKISNEERRVDWSAPAADVAAKIRAFTPAPGAWCEMQFGDTVERVKLLGARVTDEQGPLAVTCGDGGHVAITALQRPGGKPMDARTFLIGTAPDRIF